MVIVNIFLLSAFAGMISGVTGIGGGVIFTPLFKMLCDSGNFSCMAADTVYLSALVVLCSNSPGLVFSSKLSFVPFKKVRGFCLPLVIGLIASQFVIYKMSSLYHDLFLCFLVGYINILARFNSLNFCYFVENQFIIGSIVGLLSGIAGIGGSLFFIPIWHQLQLSYRQINAANTTVVLLSSATITLLAFGQGWQPPIDLWALLGVILCAMSINFLISRSLNVIEEQTVKLLHHVFFRGLFLFYLLRIFSYVYS